MWLFSSSFDTVKRLRMEHKYRESINIILSPHFDDAVFSLGGLIQKESAHTTVLTFFAGTPATPLSSHWDRMCGFLNSTEAIAVRAHEDRDALGYLGLDEKAIVHFAYLDKQYRSKHHSLQKLCEQMSRDLYTIVQSYTGKHIRLFIPMMSLHEDHRIVRNVALTLYKKHLLDKNTVEVYLYQDIPYTFLSYLKKRIFHPFSSTSTVLDLLQPAIVPCTPEVIELTHEQSQRKRIAAKKYASQFHHKFSAMMLVEKAQTHLSKICARAYGSGLPYCEIVYRVG